MLKCEECCLAHCEHSGVLCVLTSTVSKETGENSLRVGGYERPLTVLAQVWVELCRLLAMDSWAVTFSF